MILELLRANDLLTYTTGKEMQNPACILTV